MPDELLADLQPLPEEVSRSGRISEELLANLRAHSEDVSSESLTGMIRESVEDFLTRKSAHDNTLARQIVAQRMVQEFWQKYSERSVRSVGGPLSIGDGGGSITEVPPSEGPVVEEAKTVELGLLEKATDSETQGEGRPKSLLTEVRWVSAEAKRLFAKNPAALHSLHWRRFEEVVAELLADQGYDVSVVPQGKDTGVDIFAARKVELGSFLYLVQCKKYNPTHPVGLPVVDRLYGRVAADRATAGVVATTSTFTKRAKLFAEDVPFQMSLRDFDSLCEWLQIWRHRS